jgi:hypothetical protein
MTRHKLARRVHYKGQVESRYEADDLVAVAGDAVLVHRGRPRSLVIACPDGCGANLTVNLDKRAGKAWRLFDDSRGLTLHPSVWRDSGCEAHFIVWRNHIVWCDRHSLAGDEPSYDREVEARVARALSPDPSTADEIADAVSDIPWEVARALDRMAKAGTVEVSKQRPRRYWRVIASSETEAHAESAKPARPDGLDASGPVRTGFWGWLSQQFRR